MIKLRLIQDNSIQENVSATNCTDILYNLYINKTRKI